MDIKKKQKVLAVVGPTASGKSELAVRLAKEFNGEIISADSRQVYKGLDVGTGKITHEEMQGVPHYLLDVADPHTRFTASEYRELGEKVLEDILGRGRLPIVVGGTGLYIDALSCAINFPEVPPNPELREELEEMRVEDLIVMLDDKDPVRAQEVDRHNKRRIIRALEIVEALGKVPKQESNDSAHEFIYIGLLPDNLEERIRERLSARMPGMLEEARKLHTEGLTYERMRELGLEYKYLAMHLEGELTLDDMKEKLYTAIRQYAKRQMTWFKKKENIKWFKPEEYKEIETYLRKCL